MKNFIAATLLLAQSALAADAAQGSVVFFERCATCHTVNREPARKGAAPDLITRLKEKDGTQLNRWILEPDKRNKASACDTTRLVNDRESLADVWAFLQGRIEAPPAPRVERRRAELERSKPWQWRNRNRGER